MLACVFLHIFQTAHVWLWLTRCSDNSIQTSIQVETAAQIAIYSHAEQACELGHELEGART